MKIEGTGRADHSAEFSVTAAAREDPDGIALITRERALTWRALAGEARLAAERLAPELAHPPQDSAIMIGAAPEPATLFTLYALLDLARPLAPFSPRLGGPEAAAARHALAGVSLPAGTLAAIATAGTTGAPRFAALSRGAFRASAAASGANLGWTAEDRWLLCMPLHHVGGLSIVTRTLMARRPVVLTTDADPGTIATAIRDHRATLASFVPAMLDRLLALDAPRDTYASLRAVLVGGAHAGAELVNRARRAGIPALTTYGLTETCSQLTTQSPAEAREVATAPLASGRPLSGAAIRIVAGRIAARGAMLFSGYIEGGRIFPPALDDGWFVTGDVGRIEPDGTLLVLGRADDVIVTGGEKVNPLEVEDALVATGLVSAACVFGVPDARWGSIVAAALVARETRPDDATLLAAMTQRLASWKRPRRIAWCDTIPGTAAGKPDRAETARRTAPSLHEIL